MRGSLGADAGKETRCSGVWVKSARFRHQSLGSPGSFTSLGSLASRPSLTSLGRQRCTMCAEFHVRLIRHGETEANVQRVVESHTATPLNQTGRRQADALAAALRAEGATFTRVYSSDTARVEETCRRALAGCPAAPAVQLEPLLRERDGGPRLDGVSYDEAVRLQAEARRSGVPIAGLETPQAAQQRAATFFSTLMEEMSAGGEAAVFSHAGWIHLLLQLLQQRYGLQLVRELLPAGTLHFSWNTAQTRLTVRREAAGAVTVHCQYLHRDDHLTGPLTPKYYLMPDGATLSRDQADPNNTRQRTSLVD